MARVTVEDCIDKVDNQFDLVIMAAHRARQLLQGAPSTVERDGDKNTVIALREIAEETVLVSSLSESIIEAQQHQIEVDEPTDDDMAALMEPSTPDTPDDSMSEEAYLRALLDAQRD